MPARFQFSLRRAILSTGLIVIGLAAWPLMFKVELAGGLGDAFRIVCFVCLYALPIAGIGCLLGRTFAGFLLGLIVGVYYFHLNYAINF